MTTQALGELNGGSETLSEEARRLLTASEKSVQEIETPSTASEESVGEIERILKITDDNPYLTLGVNDPCSVDDSRKAYRKLSRFIHPDKCKHENATAAFIKLKAAAEKLCLDEEDEKDEDQTDNNGRPIPGKFQQQIYAEATPCIHKLFSDPDSLNLKIEIENYNKSIRARNVKNKLAWTDHDRYYIRTEGFVSNIQELHRFLREWLSSDESQQKEKKTALDKAIGKLNNFIADVVKEAYYPSEWIATFRVEDRELKLKFDNKDASTADKDDDVLMTEPSTETQRGPDIAAYSEFFTWNKVLKDYIPSNVKFIVRTKPESRIFKFMTLGQVGQGAEEAYLNSESKIDYREEDRKFSRLDAANYKCLEGVCSNAFKTSSPTNRYPPLRCLPKFEEKDANGNATEYGCWMTRTKFRDIMGGRVADDAIEDVYRSERANPPWNSHGLKNNASEKAHLSGSQTAAPSVQKTKASLRTNHTPHMNMNSGGTLISSTPYGDVDTAEIENLIKLLMLETELQKRRKQNLTAHA
ncbi:hypothetical protein EMCG_05167 [[Emmonsia] crescens]|uniref:J domain-containing protein n=1 Tax=[Emmonsia] crescens TaxID=73230 RepID=A0A0G2HPQ5_9EURO|nr:hypothetical protein EMCG_05167 [Emmonsia crescens UAMH 3008]